MAGLPELDERYLRCSVLPLIQDDLGINLSRLAFGGAKQLTDAEDERQKRVEIAGRTFISLNSWFEGQYSPPKTLAHFTTVQNALAILGSRELWMFNAHTMSDEYEVDHALDFILDEFRTHHLRHLMPAMARFIQWRKHSSPTVYVFCLSAPRPKIEFDQLSMWRAYGDDGNGAALLIDAQELLKASSLPAGTKPMLAKVLYSVQDKRRLVRGVAKEFERLCAEENRPPVELSSALDSLLWKIAPVLKHPAFAEEEEWRVVSRLESLSPTPKPQKAIQFTSGERPYIALQLPEVEASSDEGAKTSAVFEGALVGPSRRIRANAAALSAAFARFQGKAQVSASAIPYRGRD